MAIDSELPTIGLLQKTWRIVVAIDSELPTIGLL